MLYQELGQKEKAKAAFDEARRDAEALEAFPSFSYGWSVRALCYAELEDGEALRREFERAGKLGGPLLCGTQYLHWLVRRAKYAEARKVLDLVHPAGGADPSRASFRPFFLALMPGCWDEAWSAYRESLKGPVSRAHLAERHIPLLLLGRKEEAVRAFADARRQGLGMPAAGAWYEKHVEFLAGELSVEEFLRAAGASRRNLSEAHYLIAMMRLGGRDRQGARRHFELSLKTPVLFFLETDWSRTFLARMKGDEGWPP